MSEVHDFHWCFLSLAASRIGTSHESCVAPYNFSCLRLHYIEKVFLNWFYLFLDEVGSCFVFNFGVSE